MRNSDRWFKARILDYRLSKGKLFLQTLFPLFLLFFLSYLDYQATQKKSDESYEYYVHFEPLDRRNDEWVPFSRIKKTHEKIEEHTQEEASGHTNVHPNDNPHLGMNHA